MLPFNMLNASGCSSQGRPATFIPNTPVNKDNGRKIAAIIDYGPSEKELIESFEWPLRVKAVDGLRTNQTLFVRSDTNYYN